MVFLLHFTYIYTYIYPILFLTLLIFSLTFPFCKIWVLYCFVLIIGINRSFKDVQLTAFYNICSLTTSLKSIGRSCDSLPNSFPRCCEDIFISHLPNFKQQKVLLIVMCYNCRDLTSRFCAIFFST